MVLNGLTLSGNFAEFVYSSHSLPVAGTKMPDICNLVEEMVYFWLMVSLGSPTESAWQKLLAEESVLTHGSFSEGRETAKQEGRGPNTGVKVMGLGSSSPT